MTRLRLEKWLIGPALVATALASSSRARGDTTRDNRDNAPVGGPQTIGEGAGGGQGAAVTPAAIAVEDRNEPKGKGAGEPEYFRLGLDAVIGSAKSETLSQNIPVGTQPSTAPTAANDRITTYSFVLDAGFAFTPDFGLVLRAPFVTGEIFNSQFNRSASTFGNLELAAEGNVGLARDLELELELGVAFPTAGGEQFPSASALNGPQTVEFKYSDYDRFAVLQAAVRARGLEDDALFEPNYLGIIPKLKLHWGEHEGWHLDPWIKLENLVGTQTGLASSYVGELVFGVNAGVYVTKQFEPAIRVWANAPLTGADFTTVAVVEPEVRFHFGPVTPYVAAILPFAGTPLTSPYALGIRLGISGRF